MLAASALHRAATWPLMSTSGPHGAGRLALHSAGQGTARPCSMGSVTAASTAFQQAGIHPQQHPGELAATCSLSRLHVHTCHPPRSFPAAPCTSQPCTAVLVHLKLGSAGSLALYIILAWRRAQQGEHGACSSIAYTRAGVIVRCKLWNTLDATAAQGSALLPAPPSTPCQACAAIQLTQPQP